MARYCRSCKYGPVGPYVDNCPICAEPLRGGRREVGDRGGWGGMPWWARLLLGVGLSVTLSVAGCCVVTAWQFNGVIADAQRQAAQAQADYEAERQARTVAVSAGDLLAAFAADPAAADRKYRGKVLELSGVVERSDDGGRNRSPFAVLHAGDPAAPVKVECFFDGDAGPPEAGDRVTVRGEYDGRVSHVQVRGCRLVRAAARTPATGQTPPTRR